MVCTIGNLALSEGVPDDESRRPAFAALQDRDTKDPMHAGQGLIPYIDLGPKREGLVFTCRYPFTYISSQNPAQGARTGC